MKNVIDKRYYKKIKAAYLIYKEGLPLQDTAKILGISRPTLSKLIDEMHEEGIVTIKIVDPNNYQENIRMGYEIKKKYGLKDVIVAEADSESAEDIIASIGVMGAEYLQERIRSGMTIGTTGGRSIDAIVSNLDSTQKASGISVIATTGGSLYANSKYHPNTVAQHLADIYHGVGYFIYAPTYADNMEQKRMFLQNSQLAETVTHFQKIDVALAGIADAETAMQYLPRPVEQWFTEAPQSELIGAVNTFLLDRLGRPFPSSVADLNISIQPEQLRGIETVISPAGGAEKHEAIRAVLEGHYIDVLITEQYTARYLLDME